MVFTSLSGVRASWGPESRVRRAGRRPRGSGVRAGRSSGPRAFSRARAPSRLPARPRLLAPASPDSGQAACGLGGLARLRRWGRAAEKAPSAAGHALSAWTWAARSLSPCLSAGPGPRFPPRGGDSGCGSQSGGRADLPSSLSAAALARPERQRLGERGSPGNPRRSRTGSRARRPDTPPSGRGRAGSLFQSPGVLARPRPPPPTRAGSSAQEERGRLGYGSTRRARRTGDLRRGGGGRGGGGAGMGAREATREGEGTARARGRRDAAGGPEPGPPRC